MGGDRVKHHLTASPTQSTWFEHFSQGCLHRMGQYVQQDWAITLPTMNALMLLLEEEWKTKEEVHRHMIAVIGAYSLIAFCGLFRGKKVFLTDLHGLRKYFKDLATENYVIISLLVQFKGEVYSCSHLATLAVETRSGLVF
jgi:hypothetical protein